MNRVLEPAFQGAMVIGISFSGVSVGKLASWGVNGEVVVLVNLFRSTSNVDYYIHLILGMVTIVYVVKGIFCQIQDSEIIIYLAIESISSNVYQVSLEAGYSVVIINVIHTDTIVRIN